MALYIQPRKAHRIFPSKRYTIHSRGPRQVKIGLDLNELLAQAGEGNTSLERIVEAAMSMRNIQWETRQFIVDLGQGSDYTVIDYVFFSPLVAIYVDGIQHRIRPDTIARDQEQNFWLESMGWTVIRLLEEKILADPLGYISQQLGYLAG